MKAYCIWLTSVPCAGKTTIAKELIKHFPNCQWLDGDTVRNTPLANNVGFLPEDRDSHILRMGYIAKLFVDKGITVICSFVSPSRSTRDEVRKFFEYGQFIEVFVYAPIEECRRRDVKGMYKKALKGEIKNFTGVDAPYEAPSDPEVFVNTLIEDLDTCVQKILRTADPKRLEKRD